MDIFWRGIIHLHFGQTILDKTNPPSLADYDYTRPDNTYSPTRDCTLKMSGGEIREMIDEEVNNDPEMSAEAENFDQDGIERKIFCDGNVYKQMEEGEEWILEKINKKHRFRPRMHLLEI